MQTPVNMDAEHIHAEKDRKPRKIMKVKPTKCDLYEAIHSNKEYWSNVFRELDKNTDSLINESRTLSKVLPRDLYKQVCDTLNLPIVQDETAKTEKNTGRIPRRLIKEPHLSFRKCLYIDRELDSDTDVELCPSDEDAEPNVHQVLLSKPVREQITWATRYLQPEREDEKSLVKKADDLTDRIANEFCEYMKQLGGDQQSKLLTPKAIKELFQIEFDTHVSRSLRVVPKELPTVEEKIANITENPDKSRYAALEREISKDIREERRHNRVTAFGRSLPRSEQYHAPQNYTKKLWRSARHVPKDLVSLKSVWEGITNLRSVKEYCRWMIDHPEHRRPPYLSSLGMFDPAVLNARLTFEAQACNTPPVTTSQIQDTPVPLDQLRRKLSELAD